MMEEVKKLSEQPTKTAVLVDSRPDKRYTDGHIAGAVHIYWQETLVDAKNNPVFLPPDKLKAALCRQRHYAGREAGYVLRNRLAGFA